MPCLIPFRWCPGYTGGCSQRRYYCAPGNRHTISPPLSVSVNRDQPLLTVILGLLNYSRYRTHRRCITMYLDTSPNGARDTDKTRQARVTRLRFAVSLPPTTPPILCIFLSRSLSLCSIYIFPFCPSSSVSRMYFTLWPSALHSFQGPVRSFRRVDRTVDPRAATVERKIDSLRGMPSRSSSVTTVSSFSFVHTRLRFDIFLFFRHPLPPP